MVEDKGPIHEFQAEIQDTVPRVSRCTRTRMIRNQNAFLADISNALL